MRGYQKRIIYIKNVGSEIFEEAYFVVKDGCEGIKTHEKMVDEANRIINENVGKKKRFINFSPTVLLSFLLGASVSVIAVLLIGIIW